MTTLPFSETLMAWPQSAVSLRAHLEQLISPLRVTSLAGLSAAEDKPTENMKAKAASTK
jgi:hypothetical protein